jgi:hypothetical protein
MKAVTHADCTGIGKSGTGSFQFEFYVLLDFATYQFANGRNWVVDSIKMLPHGAESWSFLFHDLKLIKKLNMLIYNSIFECKGIQSEAQHPSTSKVKQQQKMK